jgi:hypothetical protein
MLYREIIAVCSQIHTKHTNTLCGQNAELLNVKLAVHIVTAELYKRSVQQLTTAPQYPPQYVSPTPYKAHKLTSLLTGDLPGNLLFHATYSLFLCNLLLGNLLLLLLLLLFSELLSFHCVILHTGPHNTRK